MENDVTQKRILKYAFSRITVTVLISVLLAAALISVANDIYAFVKEARAVSVEISSPLPLRELALTLQNEGVIDNPHVFCAYVRSKGRADSLEAFYGAIDLRTDMSYREILKEFN